MVRYHTLIAKVPLCLLVALSALFGFFLSSPLQYLAGFEVFIAVLLLACGAATLNSIQERHVDRHMSRTRGRPLAKGLLTPQNALIQARFLLLVGFAILYVGFSSLGPVLAGIVAVIIYNTIYTPLKYKSVWALIPGALGGAIPPYIGWLAGNGVWNSPCIQVVTALFVVWQIPHFWLVVLKNKADYRLNTIPGLIKMIPERSLGLLSLVWVVALVTVLHVLIILLVELPPGVKMITSSGSFLLLVLYGYQVCFKARPAYRLLFMALNIYMFLVMALVLYGIITK